MLACKCTLVGMHVCKQVIAIRLDQVQLERPSGYMPSRPAQCPDVRCMPMASANYSKSPQLGTASYHL